MKRRAVEAVRVRRERPVNLHLGSPCAILHVPRRIALVAAKFERAHLQIKARISVHHQFHFGKIRGRGGVAVEARSVSLAVARPHQCLACRDDPALCRLDVRHVQLPSAVEREGVSPKIEIDPRLGGVDQPDMSVKADGRIGSKGE